MLWTKYHIADASMPVEGETEVIAVYEDGEIEARWNALSGCIGIVDVDSGQKINDGMPIVKDRDAAIAKANEMMGI